MRMIGHMILRKNLDSDDKLGLKVVGGTIDANGRLSAIVEKVKHGSIADLEGHIQAGKLSCVPNNNKNNNKTLAFVCLFVSDL